MSGGRAGVVCMAHVVVNALHAMLCLAAGYACSSSNMMLGSHTAELRQLVEAVFSQESESVRVAVLQHLLDTCCDVLSAAPLRLGACYQGSDIDVAKGSRLGWLVCHVQRHVRSAEQEWRRAPGPW